MGCFRLVMSTIQIIKFLSLGFKFHLEIWCRQKKNPRNFSNFFFRRKGMKGRLRMQSFKKVRCVVNCSRCENSRRAYVALLQPITTDKCTVCTFLIGHHPFMSKIHTCGILASFPMAMTLSLVLCWS